MRAVQVELKPKSLAECRLQGLRLPGGRFIQMYHPIRWIHWNSVQMSRSLHSHMAKSACQACMWRRF